MGRVWGALLGVLAGVLPSFLTPPPPQRGTAPSRESLEVAA